MSKRTLKINNLELVVAPRDRPPFEISAMVEEQDVALVLGEATEMHEIDDRPVWYWSHKLASQTLRTPGEVLVRTARPLRLLAIVHDFDHEPSWRGEWVALALANVARLVPDRQIARLGVPVLGARFGRFELPAFLALLVETLLNRPPVCLTHIWLAVEADQTADTMAALGACLLKDHAGH